MRTSYSCIYYTSFIYLFTAHRPFGIVWTDHMTFMSTKACCIYQQSCGQGEMSNTDWQAVILIENMLEHFQILVEARRGCSRGWRWAPIENKVCCIYQQICGQGEMSNTDRQAAILIKILPEHFQPLDEARRSCIDQQRCELAEAWD